tara:strand:+ start:1839 stop:3260 length:1422 start_codon:yes stop_codon:yes gene_type:complete
MNPFLEPSLNRRSFLQQAGIGFGAIAASDLLAQTDVEPTAPLVVRESHFPAKAKRVIHLFMNGGPSQVDTFDPKPSLKAHHRKPLPPSIKNRLQRTQKGRVGNIWASPFEFQKHGQSGQDISELFPNMARHADDLCVIRSMVGEVANHSPGLLLTNTGHSTLPRPSVGSWLLYGLGNESEDLPGYVVLIPNGMPTAQSRNWTSSFLPGVYQGTHIETANRRSELIPHLRRRDIRSGTQRAQIALTQFLNEHHRRRRADDERLSSRIHSMELAFRMQSAATDAFDVTKEPESIRKMYGDTEQGRNMIMARRLAERGVRYVQVYYGAGQPWDNHSGIFPRIKKLCADTDKPIAALLTDLKTRGMLDDTLVIWGGEMGRTSTIQSKVTDPNRVGRDHHIDGYTIWMAGGGINPGSVYGATDEFGMGVASHPISMHDLHATILHQLGLDHKRLTYRYSGRDFRLTDVHGEVIDGILT